MKYNIKISLLIISLAVIVFLVTNSCKKELYSDDQPITDIESNVYKTVKIGDQVWMAENLKTTKYADGSPIPLINTTATWDALTTTSKAYCWYDDNITNKETYGAIYTWTAAMNGAVSSTTNPSGVQGVCPTGWHIPSKDEWESLETYLGGFMVAGGKMKETGTTLWTSPNTGATNLSGFSGLPSGERLNDGTFHSISTLGVWWSSTKYFDTSDVWLWFLRYNISWSGSTDDSSDVGFSVRCVKD